MQYGKQHIEIAQRVKEGSREGSDDEDEGGGGVETNLDSQRLGKTKSVVISRENLILVPDPELNYTGNNNLHISKVQGNHPDNVSNSLLHF